MALPTLLPVPEIHERLGTIFPEGTAHRNFLIREMAAKTVFTMLYVGAVHGTELLVAPRSSHADDRRSCCINSRRGSHRMARNVAPPDDWSNHGKLVRGQYARTHAYSTRNVATQSSSKWPAVPRQSGKTSTEHGMLPKRSSRSSAEAGLWWRIER